MKILLLISVFLVFSHTLPTKKLDKKRHQQRLELVKELRLLVANGTQRIELIERKLAVLDWIIIDHLAHWKRDLQLEMEDYLSTNNIKL
jgi:hypothetical protein